MLYIFQLSLCIVTIAFSVLHLTFYVQFTSIFNSYVTDVRLSCLLLINEFNAFWLWPRVGLSRGSPHCRVTNAPVGGGFNHFCGQRSQTLVDVFGEHFVRPVKIKDERLKRFQLPQHIFRRRAAVAVRTAQHSDWTQTCTKECILFLCYLRYRKKRDRRTDRQTNGQRMTAKAALA